MCRRLRGTGLQDSGESSVRQIVLMVGHLQAEEILTCGLSKVVIRREVKTGSLVLKLFQVGVLQRPGLCCRPSMMMMMMLISNVYI